MIYRKQYESPRYPEMRRRKPAVRRPGRCRRQGDELLPARQDRRAARRLSRDLAKALNDERDCGPRRERKSAIGWRCICTSIAFGCATQRRWSASPSTTFRRAPSRPAPECSKRMACGERSMFREAWSASTSSPHWAAGDVADVSRCIAAATRSAVTPSRTSAPAISTRRRWRGDRAQPPTTSVSLDPSIEIETFAYPFGYGSFARKQQLKDRVPDLPQHRAGRQQRHRGPAIPARDAADRPADRSRRRSSARFDEAQINNGWLIFYGHDVAERPSPYGCSPALLEPCPGGGVAPENSRL